MHRATWTIRRAQQEDAVACCQSSREYVVILCAAMLWNGSVSGSVAPLFFTHSFFVLVMEDIGDTGPTRKTTWPLSKGNKSRCDTRCDTRCDYMALRCDVLRNDTPVEG